MVDVLAAAIAREHPGLRGFTRSNLFRMRQFYETYRGDEKVAPLVRQLPWSHHVIVLGRSKLPEERSFYILMAIKQGWTKRELERQIQARAAVEGLAAVIAPEASWASRFFPPKPVPDAPVLRGVPHQPLPSPRKSRR